MDHTLATLEGNIEFTQLPDEVKHFPLNLPESSSLFVSNSSNITIKAQKFQLNGYTIYYYLAKPNENIDIIINGHTDKFRCIIAENEPLELFIDSPHQENSFFLPENQFIIHDGTQAPLKLILKSEKQYKWFKIHFSEDQIASTIKKLNIAPLKLVAKRLQGYIGPVPFTPAIYRYLKSVVRPDLFSLNATNKLMKLDILEIITQQAYGKRLTLNSTIIQKMATADGYIQTNFREKLTINKIARQVQMSESSFSSYFRLFFGVSTNVYVNELKMHKAADLIKEKNLTLQQISAHLGYKSEKGFRKSFVKHFGMLPKAFN